jgi:hypothetical protein
MQNTPDLLIKADQMSIVDSEVGVVNKVANPDYRIFLTELAVQLTNFSNQPVEGPMTVKVTGKFMGSGQTVIGATFRRAAAGPADFALAASIENTDMRTMNKLLRAHGRFDVVQGWFSVFSELTVKDGMVDGYVKPLFKKLDVYDAKQDREKSLFQKIYEGVVGGVGELLKNTPRREVATKANLSGRLEAPQTNTWEVLLRLIQNAFFRAILPGFDQEVGHPQP